MSENEDGYKKELAEAGVDVPDLEATETHEPDAAAEPEKEPPATDKTEAKAEEPDKAPLQDKPTEQRKRSIYDEYKDKKSEAKTEKERADNAERERDELKTKLEALNNAETPEEKKEAQDELDEFAKHIDADPAALRKMRDLFLKDVVKPQTDAGLLKDLEEFKAWKSQNSQVLEEQMFDREFKAIAPTLNELFPKATAEEMEAIRSHLDKVSHTPEWHAEKLDYIAFKHRETLAALVSPKKRGLEPKGRTDVSETSFEFDPNADYTKMSLKEREAWEAEYNKATKTDGLVTGANGKKLIL